MTAGKRRQVESHQKEFRIHESSNRNILHHSHFRRLPSLHEVLGAGRRPKKGFDPKVVEVASRSEHITQTKSHKKTSVDPLPTKTLLCGIQSRESSMEGSEGEGGNGNTASIRATSERERLTSYE